MKILIVDDEPDMLTGLARILKASDFEVDSARNGEEAVAKNESWKPDAVVMDIRMPKMNGIDACLEVLRDRPDIFVILMTGFSEAMDEANQGLLAEACQDHQVELMMKPLDTKRLIEFLRGERGKFERYIEKASLEWLGALDSEPGQADSGRERN